MFVFDQCEQVLTQGNRLHRIGNHSELLHALDSWYLGHMFKPLCAVIICAQLPQLPNRKNKKSSLKSKCSYLSSLFRVLLCRQIDGFTSRVILRDLEQNAYTEAL